LKVVSAVSLWLTHVSCVQDHPALMFEDEDDVDYEDMVATQTGCGKWKRQCYSILNALMQHK